MLSELLASLSRGNPSETALDEAVVHLRQLPEHEVLGFVKSYAEARPAQAMYIATRALGRGGAFADLLRHGLQVSDASAVRFWLEACVPRVGKRRAVSLFRLLAADFPAQASRVVYWTKGVLGTGDPKTLEEICEIERLLPPSEASGSPTSEDLE